jgi:hypothetical protein
LLTPREVLEATFLRPTRSEWTERFLGFDREYLIPCVSTPDGRKPYYGEDAELDCVARGGGGGGSNPSDSEREIEGEAIRDSEEAYLMRPVAKPKPESYGATLI